MNIYNRMNYKNEINIICKINKEKNQNIWKRIWRKNKDKCKIIYDNKEYELKNEFEIKNINK